MKRSHARGGRRRWLAVATRVVVPLVSLVIQACGASVEDASAGAAADTGRASETGGLGDTAAPDASVDMPDSRDDATVAVPDDTSVMRPDTQLGDGRSDTSTDAAAADTRADAPADAGDTLADGAAGAGKCIDTRSTPAKVIDCAAPGECTLGLWDADAGRAPVVCGSAFGATACGTISCAVGSTFTCTCTDPANSVCTCTGF